MKRLIINNPIEQSNFAAFLSLSSREVSWEILFGHFLHKPGWISEDELRRAKRTTRGSNGFRERVKKKYPYVQTKYGVGYKINQTGFYWSLIQTMSAHDEWIGWDLFEYAEWKTWDIPSEVRRRNALKKVEKMRKAFFEEVIPARGRHYGFQDYRDFRKHLRKHRIDFIRRRTKAGYKDHWEEDREKRTFLRVMERYALLFSVKQELDDSLQELLDLKFWKKYINTTYPEDGPKRKWIPSGTWYFLVWFLLVLHFLRTEFHDVLKEESGNNDDIGSVLEELFIEVLFPPVKEYLFVNDKIRVRIDPKSVSEEFLQAWGNHVDKILSPKELKKITYAILKVLESLLGVESKTSLQPFFEDIVFTEVYLPEIEMPKRGLENLVRETTKEFAATVPEDSKDLFSIFLSLFTVGINEMHAPGMSDLVKDPEELGNLVDRPVMRPQLFHNSPYGRIQKLLQCFQQ